MQDADQIVAAAKLRIVKLQRLCPDKFYIYFKLLFGVLQEKKSLECETMSVSLRSNRVQLEYNPNFVVSFLEELGEKDTIGLMALILIHEIDHIRYGHILKPIENMLRIPGVTLNILQVAIDLQVNMHMANIYRTLLIKQRENTISYNSFRKFREDGVFPEKCKIKPAEYSYDTVGTVPFWLGKLISACENNSLDDMKMETPDYSCASDEQGEHDGQGGEPDKQSEQGEPGESGNSDNLDSPKKKMLLVSSLTDNNQMGSVESVDELLKCAPQLVKEIKGIVIESSTFDKVACSDNGTPENILEIDTSKIKEERVSGLQDVLIYYQGLVSNFGAYDAYNKIHTLNLVGVLSKRTRLPVRTRAKKLKTLFFIDVSGSMDYKKLEDVYSVIKYLLEELGEADYVGVDTCIQCRGEVRTTGFTKRLIGGGGTRFQSSVNKLCKEGYKHFLFYTDGRISDNIIFPNYINKDEQVWLFVDRQPMYNDEHRFPGKLFYLE